VQQEIEKLKQTLGQRKVLKELPNEVESAYVATSSLPLREKQKQQAIKKTSPLINPCDTGGKMLFLACG
jgi:hypothetical protein